MSWAGHPRHVCKSPYDDKALSKLRDAIVRRLQDLRLGNLVAQRSARLEDIAKGLASIKMLQARHVLNQKDSWPNFGQHTQVFIDEIPARGIFESNSLKLHVP